MAQRKKSISGTVESFNISPKGVYESLLLVTARGTVQVNFPPESGGIVGALIAQGEEASLSVEKEEDERPSSHPVFRLVSFKHNGGQTFEAEAEPGRVKVKGTVEKLNFARHGEPNGAILDNGDFIHMKPHGAKAVGLETGMKLAVEGETRRSFVGSRVIEASVVNGIEIHPPATKKKHAHAKHAAKKKHA